MVIVEQIFTTELARNISELISNAPFNLFFYFFYHNWTLKMPKYYVTVLASNKKYKLCRDDIGNVYSLRKRKAPRLPSFV